MLTQDEKQLLLSIKTSISKLPDASDAALCFLWLTKVSEMKNNETKFEYLKRLRDNIVSNELKYPFCEPPPEGSLSKLLQASELTPKPSTIRTEFHGLETLDLSTPGDDYLPRNEIEKYKKRIRQYKSEITKYQNVLRSAFQSETLKNENVDYSFPKNVGINCRCEELELIKNQTGGNDLAKINEKLLKENEHIRKKCLKLENTVKKFNGSAHKKKEKSQVINKKLEESFRLELKSIIDKKDQIIRSLETSLNNETLCNNSSELLQTFEKKYEVLAERYQEIIDREFEKHKKETGDYRKKIERLQKLLIGKNKIGK